MTTEKYICHSMMNSFNMLISGGRNAHREICECSALYFIAWAKRKTLDYLKFCVYITDSEVI